MSKRRTKKQKAKAKHQFLLSWQPEPLTRKPKAKSGQFKATVKGQLKKQAHLGTNTRRKSNIPDFQAKNDPLALTKRDIVKSLILASFVLALELMLYLAWK